MIKKSSNPKSDESSQVEFKENSAVNAKIDHYIKENPKHWKYIQSMPPERMARALVLNEIQKNERRERMKSSILAKLNQNPEMKEHIESVVKHLPEDQREQAKINIASQAMRSMRQGQQRPSSGVSV